MGYFDFPKEFSLYVWSCKYQFIPVDIPCMEFARESNIYMFVNSLQSLPWGSRLMSFTSLYQLPGTTRSSGRTLLPAYHCLLIAYRLILSTYRIKCRVVQVDGILYSQYLLGLRCLLAWVNYHFLLTHILNTRIMETTPYSQNKKSPGTLDSEDDRFFLNGSVHGIIFMVVACCGCRISCKCFSDWVTECSCRDIFSCNCSDCEASYVCGACNVCKSGARWC